MADSAADLVENLTGGGLPLSRRNDGGLWGVTTSAVEHTGGAQLTIDCRTWHRDSHELFDYESQHIYRGKHSLRRSARIFRLGNDVTVEEDPNFIHPAASAEYLLAIKEKSSKFFIFPAERHTGASGQPRKLWLITRYLPEAQYPLSEGDIIKLGRFKLRIKQIVPENSPEANVDYALDDSSPDDGGVIGAGGTSSTTAQQQQMNQQVEHGPLDVIQCRICLLEGTLQGEEEDIGNPLVRPCQCKGSIMYVHLECLRHWVNGRLNLAGDLSRSCCFVRPIQCELCKALFPSFVMAKGEKLPVVKIPPLQPPFIVLENLVGANNRGVHLCSLAQKKECKLGRGHESDVRIADVSISRWHATITYVDGVFHLEDHESKFGTLVAIRKPVVMNSTVDRLAVQVGRTVMDLGIVNASDAAGATPPRLDAFMMGMED